jgi:hypothetical protein
MMKKIIVIVLCLFLFTGCTTSEDNETNEEYLKNTFTDVGYDDTAFLKINKDLSFDSTYNVENHYYIFYKNKSNENLYKIVTLKRNVVNEKDGLTRSWLSVNYVTQYILIDFPYSLTINKDSLQITCDLKKDDKKCIDINLY